MPDKKVDTKGFLQECLILIVLAVVSSFAFNYFSASGIAMVGEWDTQKGVVNAKAKNDVVNHGLEIESAAEARNLYDKTDAVFVDARSADTYRDGHIKGAVSFPVNEFDELIGGFMEKYAPDTFIITYCSGRECEDSHHLAQHFFEAGYFEISVFIDGFPAWESEGYPIETSIE